MLIGGAIGDAWGMPVEGMSHEEILEKYPQGITKFEVAKHRKWFDVNQHEVGETTDDTQLTLATLKGIIDSCKNVNGSHVPLMDAIAKRHCEAYSVNTDGWGKSSRESVRCLQNGVHWSKSGQASQQKGLGNGVPMKISPLAAWAISSLGNKAMNNGLNFYQWCVDFSSMTHWTNISAFASIIHVNAIRYCLICRPSRFNSSHFFDLLKHGSGPQKHSQDQYDTSHLNAHDEDIYFKMNALEEIQHSLKHMSTSEIIGKFGAGSCYVGNSLPFSYAFLCKNPYSLQILQSVVEAGGDTDTNAKFVGEMLGALHGIEHFHTYLPWAIASLKCKQEIYNLGHQFCDLLEIK